MEFFPKDTDKYRDAVLSAAAAKKGEDSSAENHHDCCCNICGDNINQRAQTLSEAKFTALKQQHSKELTSTKIKDHE